MEENKQNPVTETPTVLTTVKEAPISFWKKAKNFFSPHNRNRRIVGAILSVLILAGAVGTGVYLTEQRANTRTQASGAVLSLSPTNANPKVGDTFTVAVAINTSGLSATGADLKIGYDPNILEAQSIQAGTFLPTVFVPGSISNGVASITVGALTDTSGPHPASGVGVLAQIVFRAKAPGTTTISYNSSTAVAAVGQSSNVAGTLTPVQITVSGTAPSPSGTPVPTPTKSPSPTPTKLPTPIPTVMPACLPVGASCTGPADTRCCKPVGCDLVPKSGGLYRCGVPQD